MKKIINTQTFETKFFAEKENEIDEKTIDCTDGVKRWTDKIYRNWKISDAKAPVVQCESKYKKIVQNDNYFNIVEMTESEKTEKDKILENEDIKQQFENKKYKIEVSEKYFLQNEVAIAVKILNDNNIVKRYSDIRNKQGELTDRTIVFFANELNINDYNTFLNDTAFKIQDVNNFLIK